MASTWGNFALPSQNGLGTTGNSSAAKKRRELQAYQSPLADAFDQFRQADADAAAKQQQAQAATVATQKAAAAKTAADQKAKNDQINKLTQQKQQLLTPAKTTPMAPGIGGPSQFDVTSLTNGTLVANQKKAAAIDAQINAIKNPPKPGPDNKQKLDLRGFTTNTKDKTLFGIDVKPVLGNDLGRITNISANKQATVSLTAKQFLDQYNKLNPDAQKAYLNVLTTAANKDKDKAAAQTLAVLHDNGKLNGNFNDFVDAANDKLYGGLTRSVTNTANFVSGGKTKKATDNFLHSVGEADDQNQAVTTAGKVGAKFGNVESGVVQAAELALPATAITKVTEASKLAKIADEAANGSKTAQRLLKLAKAAPGAAVGGAVSAQQDVGSGNAANLKKDAAISVALDLAGPGGKVVGGASKDVIDTLTKKTAGAVVKDSSSAATKAIADKGLISSADKLVSDTGKKLVYKGSDLLSKTGAGQAIIRAKDGFTSKFIDEMAPAYKALKRLDFEGKGDSEVAAKLRGQVADYHRSSSASQAFMDENKNLQDAFKIASGGNKDALKAKQEFEDYANARSDKELHDNNGKTFTSGGKQQTVKGKTFSDEKYATDSATVAAGDAKYGAAYDKLTKYYQDLNDFTHEKGLISDDTHQLYKDSPHDYIRQQRDLEDFQIDGGGGKGNGGGLASSGKSAVGQKRNEFADGDLLPTFETLAARTQQIHKLAAANDVKKTLTDALVKGGQATVKRNTADVLARKALLNKLSEGKPVLNKLNRTLRSKSSQVKSLTSELNKLNQKGLDLRTGRAAAKRDTTLPDFHPSGLGGDVPTSQAGKGGIRETKNFKMTDGERSLMESLGVKNNANKLGDKDTKAFLRNLVTSDPADIKAVRAMIERREPKLASLLDQVDKHAQQLDGLHQERKAIYQQAHGLQDTVGKKSSIPQITYLDKGVENVVKVDPAIAHAIGGWSAESQNVLTGVLRATNNVFKYGTTGANIGFALPNLVSDLAGIATHTKAFKETFAPSNFVNTFFNTIGKPLNKEEKLKLQIFDEGNKGSTTINQYRAATKARVEADKQMLANVDKVQKTYTYFTNPVAAGRALKDSVESLVALPETFGRQLSFRGQLQKGLKQNLSREEIIAGANQASRENSIDFAAAGTYGRVINNLIPYFNAAIQDSRQIGRTISERPVTFVARATAIVGVPVAATTIWNTEDKHRREIYDTIPDYVKQTNIVVVGPNAKWNAKENKWDGVFIMKKPPGLSGFAEPARKAIEYMNADGSDKKLSNFIKGEGLKDVADAANNASPIDLSSKSRAVNSVVPQALKPIVEGATNTDLYSGQQIVSDSLLKKDKADQVRTDADGTQHSSYISRAIGGKLDVAPLAVDHFIKATFGEVGTNIQNLGDRGIKTATGDKNDNNVGGRDLQTTVARRFIGAPGGADTDAFYSAFKPAQNTRTSITARIKLLQSNNQPQEAARIADEYNSSLNDRFKTFKAKFGSSPTYDPSWDDKIEKLQIATGNIGQRKDHARKYVYGKGYVGTQ